MSTVKVVEGANCRNCGKQKICDYLKEGFSEMMISQQTGCEVSCCDYVWESDMND